jgi:hypothetical protein
MKNSAFDGTGQWKFALDEGAATQARTPGKAKAHKNEIVTDELIDEEEEVQPFERTEPNTANKLMSSAGTPNLIGDDFAVLKRK